MLLNKRLIEIVIVATAIACINTTDPKPYPSGTLSVTLSGALTNVYNASGSRPRTYTREVVTFAYASLNPAIPNELTILAYRGREGRQDMLALYLLNPATGSHPASGEVDYGMDTRRTSSEGVFFFVSGTTQVTSLTADRIQGTFSAVAVRFPPGTPPDTLILSMGQFDLPMLRLR